MDMSLSELWELVMDREAWRAVIHWVSIKNPSASAGDGRDAGLGPGLGRSPGLNRFKLALVQDRTAVPISSPEGVPYISWKRKGTWPAGKKGLMLIIMPK